MTAPAVRTRPRALAFTALAVTLMWATAACGEDAPAAKAFEPDWDEPSSYTYTLESAEGERALIGRFEVTVKDGEVVSSEGLDESGRRVVEELPDQVPTIGELLEEVKAARKDDADKVEVDYASDGHPTRISLDWDENAIDDEAEYAITDYEEVSVIVDYEPEPEPETSLRS